MEWLDDPKLQTKIEALEIVNENTVLIIAKEVSEKISQHLIAPGEYRQKLQNSVGEGLVIKKCEHDYSEDPKYDLIGIGDRLVYPSGTPISAHFDFDEDLHHIAPTKLRLIKYLHVGNILGKYNAKESDAKTS